jgi:hypothetical protein
METPTIPLALASPVHNRATWSQTEPRTTYLSGLVAFAAAQGEWVVRIDGYTQSSAALFSFLPDVRTRPVSESFIDAYDLRGAITAIRDVARVTFDGNRVTVTQQLAQSGELGDYLRISVGVSGLSRDEFRSRKDAFDEALESLGMPTAFERIVVVVSRGGEAT